MLTRLRARIARRLATAGPDRGVTLVELLVTTTIASILAASALGMFLAANKATGADLDANVTSTSARGALDSWTGLLQTATLPGTTTATNSTTNPQGGLGQAVFSFTPTSVIIYTNLGNRSSSSNAATTGASLRKLEWRAGGASNCPTSAAPGCLVETALNPTDGTSVLSVRTLVTRVTPGAASAAGACGSVVAAPGDINAGVSRLFSACGSGSTTLSAACAPTPCTSTTEDPTVLTTTNIAAGVVGTLPTTIVIAFTATNSDSNGDTHTQSYVSAATVSGSLVPAATS